MENATRFCVRAILRANSWGICLCQPALTLPMIKEQNIDWKSSFAYSLNLMFEPSDGVQNGKDA